MEINLLGIDIDPYKKLWSAVLINAKIDLVKEKNLHNYKHDVITSKQNQIMLNRHSTVYWFNNDSNEEIGSFIWICEFLKKDFKNVRRQIFEHVKLKGVTIERHNNSKLREQIEIL